MTVGAPPTLAVGACADVFAYGTDADGVRGLVSSGGYFVGPNLKVATVTPGFSISFSPRLTLYGRLCGVANGFTYVYAILNDVQSEGVLVDVGQPVASVRVTPATAIVRPGTSVQLSSAAVDQFGTAVGRAAAWSSSNPAVMSVSQGGLVTGVSVGSATIRATISGKTGTASVVTQINGGTISGPGVISSPGSYSWTANPVPAGSYSYVWDIITYGNNQHFSRSGNPVTLTVGSTTGQISLLAKAYLGGVYVGNLQPKVVGNTIGGGGGCGGKIC